MIDLSFRRRLAAMPLVILGLLGAALGGCSRDTAAYPSLAVRPAEKQGFAEPVVPPAVLKPDPALDQRIARIGDRLQAIEQEFAKAHDQARASARKARGQAAGSEAWLTAQTELATLDEIRARSSAMLAEIDDLAIARAAELQPDYPALVGLRARIAQAVARQGQQIDTLSAGLSAA
ncbi:hypothetical protein [Sphingomonas sp.]|uniref:hypothetical protein n=1 Tax=Sphingomonas sp. TaxID=28214 RepID=UPI0028978385|nr:hypothetical protein [Sphingomonas sp.]